MNAPFTWQSAMGGMAACGAGKMKTNTHSPDGLRPSSDVEIRIPEGDYVEIQTKWIGRHGVRIPTDRREFIGPGRLVFIPDEDDDESEP